MNTQRLTGRQWAAIVILSYCAALALSMRFAMPEIYSSQWISASTELVWNLRISLSGTSGNSTLLFGGLVGVGVLVCRMKKEARPPRALLPVSFLIALVWLMGVSFRVDDTLGSLTASPGQIVKSVCYLAGSTYLLYELGQLLFFFLEKGPAEEPVEEPVEESAEKPVEESAEKPNRQGNLVQMYREHPFRVSLVAILLLWLPYLIAAYPGYMCYDAWYQLTQFFGKMAFTAHHPPAHTIFIGTFTRLGLTLGNANIGLYSSIIVQAVTAASVLAYALFLMSRWHSPQWLRVISFGIVVLVPYYTFYVGMEIKDVPYSLCFLLFVLELLCMLEKGTDYFTSGKQIFLLTASMMGTILFRNNGKYALYPTVFVLLAYFWSTGRGKGKKEWIRAAAFLLAPVLAANLLTVAMTARYDIERGSIREALSLPFQQTARYLLECGNEVTAEEEEAIRAVLDYDHLAEWYSPVISDPVKGTYKDTATTKDLLRYLAVWAKMFFKHPMIYIKATMNQNYYLLYPFVENGTMYVETLPWNAGELIDKINGGLGISEPGALQNYRTTMNGICGSCFSLPVIGMLSHQAPYCILMILLIVFAIHKKRWRLIVAIFPVVLSAIIVVLAPMIQGDPRYAFPIIYSMPILLAYYIHTKKPDPKP